MMYMTSEREQGAFEKFLNGYLAEALWSSIDDNDDPLDKNYSTEEISPEFMELAKQDCWSFLNGEHGDSELTEIMKVWPVTYNATAGCDFWLTRNGHGAGFWDGDWDFTKEGGEDLGDRLTERAKQYPQIDLYVGDDWKIYGE